ncbi:MAG: hypothetical protein BWY75_02072 [bacterium ADurb.Bin425]|nr:MAG: hypothetical protein BWY75_02072 [bacterium ADurb.Bin425]
MRPAAVMVPLATSFTTGCLLIILLEFTSPTVAPVPAPIAAPRTSPFPETSPLTAPAAVPTPAPMVACLTFSWFWKKVFTLLWLVPLLTPACNVSARAGVRAAACMVIAVRAIDATWRRLLISLLRFLVLAEIHIKPALLSSRGYH